MCAPTSSNDSARSAQAAEKRGLRAAQASASAAPAEMRWNDTASALIAVLRSVPVEPTRNAIKAAPASSWATQEAEADQNTRRAQKRSSAARRLSDFDGAKVNKKYATPPRASVCAATEAPRSIQSITL